MARDRFELSPGKPSWVRVFTLEGTIELESTDNETAQLLVEVLNAFVSDIVVSRQQSPPEQITSPSDWLFV
jgi:hypothetical protein